MKVKSVKEYIAAKPRDVQRVLLEVRDIIRKAIPRAEEGISYQIPAYRLDDRLFLFFAGWKNHYALYPVSARLVEAFKPELAAYKLSKGTVRFPYDKPMPRKLIERIARFKAKESSERDRPKRVAVKKGGSGRMETQLERIRRICAGMPSVFEKLSHGAPAFFVQKDKGVFVMFADSHHNDGHVAIWAPAKPGMQEALIGDAPKTYFKPPYVGVGGWIGIELDQIGDESLEIHVREAWELAALKKKKAKSK